MVSAGSLSETTGFRLLVATAEHIFFFLCFFVIFLTRNHLTKGSVCFSISCSSSRVQIKDSGLIAVKLSFRVLSVFRLDFRYLFSRVRDSDLQCAQNPEQWLKQRPHYSPLGVKFKFSDEHPFPFPMGVPPGFSNY